MYCDSRGMTLAIGEKLGEGGEGAVFVTGDAGLVAKIYSRPLTQVQFAKLQAMVSVCDDALRSIAAWPVGMVYLGTRPVGFTMPRLTAQVPLHELFGPKRRQVLFPDAHWRFLVHTAVNVSRAFEVTHAREIVVGDVNSNNVVVYRDSKTHLIDCDSFQVAARGTVFRCEVGVPEYQPPELHGKDLTRLDRLPQHDLFGLAVMIFQLLFVGKHPFAGVLPMHMRNTAAIGDNVAARRYFYGPQARRMGLQPPPGTLNLTAITPLMSTLFAEAFLGDPSSRPSAAKWTAALEDLKSKTTVCKRIARHYHLVGTRCPWCALEHRGLYYFVPSSSPLNRTLDASILQGFTDRDVERIWTEITRVKPPPIDPRIVKERVYKPAQLKLWKANRIAGYFAAAPACFAGIAGLSFLHEAWFASALAIVGIALAVLCRPDARPVMAVRRRRYSQTYRDYVSAADEWARVAENLPFCESLERLSHVRRQLRDQRMRFTADLNSLARQRAQRERAAFLRGHRIATHGITGVDQRTLALLVSQGIETAADLTESQLERVPKLGRRRKNALSAWRRKIEMGFRFDAKTCLDHRLVRDLKERHVRERIAKRAELCQGAMLLRKIASDIQRQRPSLRKLTAQRAELMWQAEADVHVSPIWYRI
jgi:DNA-binding helix-hairpin-helix protein with protein kinase domain